MVGVIGFGPTASWSQTRRSARLSYTPRTLGTSVVPTFRRGDCNGDNRTNISDAILHTRMLFQGAAGVGCDEACDSNGDGKTGIDDAIYLIDHLFKGGMPPPAPFAACGGDPDPGISLGCTRVACQ